VQDAFYRSEHAGTVRLARLLTGSIGTAEDLAHAAFVRVHRARPPLVDPAAFLRSSTVDVCRDWHRTRRRETLRIVSANRPTRSLSVGARELEAVLTRLPFRQRATLVLACWLNLDDADIGVTIGCRPSTVARLRNRMRHLQTDAHGRMRSHMAELAEATPMATPPRFDADRRTMR
jgi:DNA-directed RNA polymerase specialized sigma24 family protein